MTGTPSPVEHNPQPSGDGSAPDEARLEFADELQGRLLHGAWWPRSDDPNVELRTLADALPASLGSVARVALSRTGWSTAPRRVERSNPVSLRVGWFTVVDPNVLTLVRTDDSRLRLLIVPPAADPQAADSAMHAAVTAEETHQSPGEFLSHAGVADVPQQRRTEGGLLAGGSA